MKILHVLTSTEVGGGPHAVLALARGLLLQGDKIAVAGPEGPVADRFRQIGCEWFPVRADRLRSAAFRELTDVIRLTAPDVVVSHGKGAGLCARLVGPRLRVPVVHVMHGFHYESYGPIRHLYVALERRLAQRSAALIHVSRSQRAECQALGIRSPHDAVVPNGIDPDAVGELAPASGLPAGQILLGTVTRFDPIKRLPVLVEMLRHLPKHVRLQLVGYGPEVTRLWDLSGRLGVSDRLATGFAWPASIRMQAFDVFVTASAKEGCPLALLEAMALGLPCVATNIPAHQELLQAPGQLAGPTPERMAYQVGWLLRHEPEFWAHLGQQNAARVRRDFTVGQMVEGHRRVYEEMA